MYFEFVLHQACIEVSIGYICVEFGPKLTELWSFYHNLSIAKYFDTIQQWLLMKFKYWLVLVEV